MYLYCKCKLINIITKYLLSVLIYFDLLIYQESYYINCISFLPDCLQNNIIQSEC